MPSLSLLRGWDSLCLPACRFPRFSEGNVGKLEIAFVKYGWGLRV